MKTIRLVPILFAAVVSLQNAEAQSMSMQANGEELAFDTTAIWASLSGKYNSGKTYLKWTIANQRVDGIYLIYRSTDGINFENIGYKEGIGVSISKEIAYYFSDNSPAPGIVQYKIVHVGNNKTCLYSKNIEVACDKSELVSK